MGVSDQDGVESQGVESRGKNIFGFQAGSPLKHAEVYEYPRAVGFDKVG